MRTHWRKKHYNFILIDLPSIKDTTYDVNIYLSQTKYKHVKMSLQKGNFKHSKNIPRWYKINLFVRE